MEHFKSPFLPHDLAKPRAAENRRFFEEMLLRSQDHPYYRHPFLSFAANLSPSREGVSFVLKSIYKVVAPFTGLLCSLGGRAPDLRTRFALMDNIYEEMGRGQLATAHPNLYLRMLESIGVSPAEAEREDTLPVVMRINEHLRDVVDHRSFAVACAVLASVEAVIPPLFPILSRLSLRAFPNLDLAFFDRHGTRDEGHSDDAAMLFAVCAAPSDYRVVEAEIAIDLDYRADLLDEWLAAVGPSHDATAMKRELAQASM